MSIKFEVGKYYRTENGGKVRVIATDGLPMTPIVGIRDGVWLSQWPLNGAHLLVGFSIVSEWIDKPSPPWNEVPKWFKWFAVDADGRQYYYSQKPQIVCRKRWSLYYEMMEVPTSHRIPVTCDWKDSLVERPTV